jgi:flagella basal body P-ring formation protein FlgA
MPFFYYYRSHTHHLATVALSLVSVLVLSCTAHGEVRISATALEHDIQDWIRSEYQPQWGSTITEHRITCQNIPANMIRLNGEALSTQVELTSGKTLLGRSTAIVTLKTTQEERRLLIPFHVEVAYPAWVATSALSARSDLNAQNSQQQVVWTDNLKQASVSEAFSTLSDLSQRRTRFYVNSGSLLSADNTEVKPAVIQNNWVTLILSLPNTVSIKTQGLALENGIVGQQIRIARQVPGSTRRLTYSGTVTRENTVEVSL